MAVKPIRPPSPPLCEEVYETEMDPLTKVKSFQPRPLSALLREPNTNIYTNMSSLFPTAISPLRTTPTAPPLFMDSLADCRQKQDEQTQKEEEPKEKKGKEERLKPSRSKVKFNFSLCDNDKMVRLPLAPTETIYVEPTPPPTAAADKAVTTPLLAASMEQAEAS